MRSPGGGAGYRESVPLLRRAPALPDDVRRRLDLEGDAVLASAETTLGWVVGTRRGLRVVEAETVLARYWSDVDGARLDPETATLSVTWVDGTAPTHVVLADPTTTALARLVHERVQSSVVHHETVNLPGRRSVRVVLRRGHDGELFTQVVGPGTVDLDDPVTAAAVDAAESRVRGAAGLA